MEFRLKSDYRPMGDQPTAIAALEASLRAGNARQTLLGVTGSGKTFTMANLIVQQQRPTLDSLRLRCRLPPAPLPPTRSCVSVRLLRPRVTPAVPLRLVKSCSIGLKGEATRLRLFCP